MAFLFRPVAVKPIPEGAIRTRIKGKEYVRWTIRGGGTVTAEVTASGKCRVRSPVWWCEYRDARGLRQRQAISRDRAAAQHKMAEIIKDVERAKGGLLPKSQTAAGETLLSLAAEYRDYLEDMGRTPKHAANTYQRLKDVLRDCRWTTAADVTLSRWARWIGEARGDGSGFSSETINHYLRSLRAFFRWLIRDGRLQSDPLVAAEPLNADADRRIRRRVLTPPEFARFIKSTREGGEVRVGLDGPARAALYLMAARTGLRAGTLASLTPNNLHLDDETPHVRIEARRMKQRKEFRVPIPAAALKELRPWLASRGPGLLWPGGWHRDCKGGKMVRRDLVAAGIRPETPEGSFDFHALRSVYITDLALAGVPIQVAQQLAGHSTPAITARFYTRLKLADLGAAADRLGSGLGKKTSKDPSIPTPAAPKRTRQK